MLNVRPEKALIRSQTKRLHDVSTNHSAHLFLLIISETALADKEADVVIYGSTPAGCLAAVAASREGSSVILLEPTDHIGGVNTGGLSLSDSFGCLRKSTLGGLWREWHQRIIDDYRERGIELRYSLDDKDGTKWTWEPHVAMRVTRKMLDEAGVTLLTGCYLKSVRKEGPRITFLVTKNARSKAGSSSTRATKAIFWQLRE